MSTKKNKSGDGIIIKKFLYEKLSQKKQEKIIIPDKIGKLPVVELGEGAFRGYHRNQDGKRETVFYTSSDNDTICHNIIIPDTVTKIGAECFAFSVFIEISLPATVTEIGAGCFAYSRFMWISLPSRLEHIEDEVFMYAQGSSIKLPDSVLTIGERAFAFSSTSCIELSENLKSIGVEAFHEAKIPCSRYYRGLKLYEGIETIGDRAFLDSSIRFISADDYDKGRLKNLKTIGKDAFKGCELINSFEEKVIANLDAIVAANNADATETPNPASDFKYDLNSERTGVVIKEYTSKRKKVIIPATIEGFPVVALASGSFFESDIVSVVIPDSVVEIWGGYNYPRTPGPISSRPGAFSYCTLLKKVILPKGLKIISESCFVGCSSLKEITLPEGLEEIEWRAFSYSALESIVIPDSVKKLNGFSHCKKLKTVTIGRGVQEIGDSKNVEVAAFAECTALTTVIGGDNVGKIGKRAFKNCTSLTNISIGKKLQVVEDSAFKGCTSLTNFTMDNNLKKDIGSEAFKGCKKLTTVTIGDNLISIGYSAFAECEALTTVTIGDNLKRIGSFAFSKCKALTTVTIGKGIKEMGDCAFKGCSSLTTFNIDARKPVRYSRDSFEGCSSLSLKEKAKIMETGYSGKF